MKTFENVTTIITFSTQNVSMFLTLFLNKFAKRFFTQSIIASTQGFRKGAKGRISDKFTANTTSELKQLDIYHTVNLISSAYTDVSKGLPLDD